MHSAVVRKSDVRRHNAAMDAFLDLLEDADAAQPEATARDLLPDWTVAHLRQKGLTEAAILAYARVIDQARRTPRPIAAPDFLARLSASDLRALTRAHGRERPLQPALLTREEAMALLNPFAVAPGALPSGQFPPPTAPQAVQGAWREAAKGLADLELLDAMGPFLAQSAAINTRYDQHDEPVACLTPTDPRYCDIYQQARFTFDDQADYLLEVLELGREFLEPRLYHRRRRFMDRYRRALTHSAAA
ncbi:MAG: hypothetical protein HQL82_07545 [Magnetococcales bacterium]|nr:hypothetical protein [Magnetococcales bacterium]